MLNLGGILSGLATPARALLVALAGVLLAWLWFEGNVGLAIVLAIGFIVIAAVLTLLGDRILARWPKTGVRLLEAWILLPTLAAAIGSAVVIAVAVELTLPDGTPTETKELISALSTGITSFITAVSVSWASDDDDSRLADFIRDRFYAHFKRQPGTAANTSQVVYFTAGSPCERWVYAEETGGIAGWSRPSRLKRAAEIARCLPARQAAPAPQPDEARAADATTPGTPAGGGD